jgi:hypothetical protein
VARMVMRARRAGACGSRVHGDEGTVSCVVANGAVVAVVVVALWSRCHVARWWWPCHGHVVTSSQRVVVAMVVVVVMVCRGGRGWGCARTVVDVMDMMGTMLLSCYCGRGCGSALVALTL